jgi:septal ring factor EnvC (AmiA/AmiB activator)
MGAIVKYGEYRGYEIKVNIPFEDYAPTIRVEKDGAFVKNADTIKKAKETIDRLLVSASKFKPFDAYYRGDLVRVNSVSADGNHINFTYKDKDMARAKPRMNEWLGNNGAIPAALKPVTNRNAALLRDIEATKARMQKLQSSIREMEKSMDEFNDEIKRAVKEVATAKRG